MGTTVTTRRPFSRLRALLRFCAARAAERAGSGAAGAPEGDLTGKCPPCWPALYPNSFSAMTPASGVDSAPNAPMMHLHRKVQRLTLLPVCSCLIHLAQHLSLSHDTSRMYQRSLNAPLMRRRQ